jgi:heat shock protein HtpX
MGNKIRTTILLAVMTALIIWIGQIFGGQQGMIIAQPPASSGGL